MTPATNIRRGENIMLPEPAKYLAPDALDHLIFKTTVPEDHYLRQVRAVIDFERFRADMAS